MRRPFLRGDIFVLCTDGLWDMLTRQEIGDISGSLDRESSPVDVEKVVDQMVNTALERGATDNVTAVVVLAIDSSPAIDPPYSRGLFRRWMHR
jgi:protein phosphatase